MRNMQYSTSGFRVVATILCLQIGMAVGQVAEELVTTTRSSSQSRSHPHDDDSRTLRLLLSSNDSADMGVHHQTLASVNLTSSQAVPMDGDEDNFSASPFDEPTALMGEIPLVTGPPRAVQTPGGSVIQDDSDPFQTTVLPLLEAVESSDITSTTLKPSPDSSLVLARNSDGRVSLEERTAGPKVLGIATTWTPTTTMQTSDVSTDSTISAKTSGDFAAVKVSTTHTSDAETHSGMGGGNRTPIATTATIPLVLIPVESSSHSLPPTTISIEESLTTPRTLLPPTTTSKAAASSTETTPTTSISFSSTAPTTPPVGAVSGHTHWHQFTHTSHVTPLDSSGEDDNIIAGLNNNRSIFGEDTSSSPSLPASAIIFHPVGDGNGGNANGSSTVWPAIDTPAPTSPTSPVPTSHTHLIVEEIGGKNATSQTPSTMATAAEELSTRPSTTHESPNGVTTEQPILLHPTESEMPSSAPHGDGHPVESTAATAPTHHQNASSTSTEALFDSLSVAAPTMTTSTSTIIQGGEDDGSTVRGEMDHNATTIMTSDHESTTSKSSTDLAITDIQSSTIIVDQVSSAHHPIELNYDTSSTMLPITSSSVNDSATQSHHHNEATLGIETTTGHEPIATTLYMGIQNHDHQEATHAVANTSPPPASTLPDIQTETTTENPHSLWHSHHEETSSNAFKTSFSLRFPNIDFSPQFNDPESGMSRKLKEQITPELDDVLRKTIGEENYAGFRITSARKGSLIVDGEILTRTELAADTTSIASRLEENIAAAGSRLGGNSVDIESIKVNGILSRGPADPSHHLSHTTDSSTHTGYVVAGAVGIGILITVFAIFAVIVFGVNSKRAARRTLKMGEEIGMTERGQGVSCTRLGDGEVNFMSYGTSPGENTASHRRSGASASNGASPYISPMVLNGSQFTPPSTYKK